MPRVLLLIPTSTYRTGAFLSAAGKMDVDVTVASEHPNDFFPFLNCKIPFLNGGLFEPINDYNWEETDIRIDNDLIAEVFKTFDQYNFTVREDEPLEKFRPLGAFYCHYLGPGVISLEEEDPHHEGMPSAKLHIKAIKQVIDDLTTRRGAV